MTASTTHATERQHRRQHGHAEHEAERTERAVVDRLLTVRYPRPVTAGRRVIERRLEAAPDPVRGAGVERAGPCQLEVSN